MSHKIRIQAWEIAGVACLSEAVIIRQCPYSVHLHSRLTQKSRCTHSGSSLPDPFHIRLPFLFLCRITHGVCLIRSRELSTGLFVQPHHDPVCYRKLSTQSAPVDMSANQPKASHKAAYKRACRKSCLHQTDAGGILCFPLNKTDHKIHADRNDRNDRSRAHPVSHCHQRTETCPEFIFSAHISPALMKPQTQIQDRHYKRK